MGPAAQNSQDVGSPQSDYRRGQYGGSGPGMTGPIGVKCESHADRDGHQCEQHADHHGRRTASCGVDADLKTVGPSAAAEPA